MQWLCKHFHELGVSELYALMRLRQEVFVLEQRCAYVDADGADPDAHHLMGTLDGTLLACARILKPGARYAQASIGRVVTVEAVRGTGVGKLLMREALQFCLQRYPAAGIRISAQARLEDFYERLGFKAEGPTYDEDGIPHLAMIWKQHF